MMGGVWGSLVRDLRFAVPYTRYADLYCFPSKVYDHNHTDRCIGVAKGMKQGYLSEPLHACTYVSGMCDFDSWACLSFAPTPIAWLSMISSLDSYCKLHRKKNRPQTLVGAGSERSGADFRRLLRVYAKLVAENRWVWSVFGLQRCRFRWLSAFRRRALGLRRFWREKFDL